VLKSEKGSRLGFINIFVFSVKLNLISKHKQCSKWAGICRYTIPELISVPDFHTGTSLYPTVAHGSTPQNFALWKGGTKQYVATKNGNPICKPLIYID
jgi:hypothetical protein